MIFQLHSFNGSPISNPDTLQRIPNNGVDPEFVISRDKSGKVLSRYKDKIWDCRIYGATTTYSFEGWWDINTKGAMDSLANTLTDEIKTIFWLSMFEISTNAGRARGASHLHQLNTVLRSIAKIAHGLGVPLAQTHTSAQFQVALRSSISNSKSGFSHIHALTAVFKDTAFWQQLDTIECDVPRIVPEDELNNILSLLHRKHREKVDQREQHPLIPTRLFGKLISEALNQLKAVEPYLPHIEEYIKAVYADPTLNVDKHGQYENNLKRVKRLYPDHKRLPAYSRKYSSSSETLERFNLSSYAKRTELSNLQQIESHITHLLILCIILIHSHSAMRTSEVQVMPFNPSVPSKIKGLVNLPVLMSHLKKFSHKGNYSCPLVWATSEEGLYAVKIAQELTRIKWFQNNPQGTELPSNIPLFASITDDKRASQHIHYDLPIATRPFDSSTWRKTIESLGLVIEAEDLEELRVFDAFRDWDENPDFAEGNFWPLVSHQIRRSVAVYASRSGMVSLPTLKTQFKHLSEVMTALYSENSTYAQNFLIDENGKPIDNGSVLMAFRDAIAFNTSVRFHEQVIQSEQRLGGAIGAEIQRAKDKGYMPKMFQSREETEKAVRQGRFSYRETPVGGCTLKGSCRHLGVDVVLPCTQGCENAILTQEKLATYIESLRFDQRSMSPKSRPHQLITKEIEHITANYLKLAEHSP